MLLPWSVSLVSMPWGAAIRRKQSEIREWNYRKILLGYAFCLSYFQDVVVAARYWDKWEWPLITNLYTSILLLTYLSSFQTHQMFQWILVIVASEARPYYEHLLFFRIFLSCWNVYLTQLESYSLRPWQWRLETQWSEDGYSLRSQKLCSGLFFYRRNRLHVNAQKRHPISFIGKHPVTSRERPHSRAMETLVSPTLTTTVARLINSEGSVW
jgi:hypothetical protein